MTAVLDPVAGVEGAAARRVRFTRGQVDRLLDLGAFAGQRFELIDGDLIDKMGQNRPHALSLLKIQRILMRLFGMDRVRAQMPIEVADVDRELSYPEPDICVIAANFDEKSLRHPTGGEITLGVEVADSTVRFDQTVKAGIYARAGVPEYWVLDVNRRVLHVFRQPVDGQYSVVLALSAADVVSPEALPGEPVSVSEILPA